MKNIYALVLATALFASCDHTKEKNTAMQENQNEVAQPANDKSTPKVTGIGGVFFNSENPEKTKEWYTKNLGINMNAWGSASFDTRDVNDPERIHSLQWKPFKEGDEYFAPSNKPFMINYMVQNIEGMVAQLEANGVTILDSIVSYDGIGKFVHIMDAEDNKIELWEPAD